LDKLIRRLKILDKTKESDDWKARIIAACMGDPIFFINTFCWTKDPRPGQIDKIIPFFCYEFQENLILNVIQHIKDGRDLLIEKSRDMGVTWCLLYTFLWFWLFQNGYDFLLGSQTQKDVDEYGDPKSLFERLRINLRLMPNWLLPRKYASNQMRIINHINNSTIVGEANTGNFSRQGRFSAIMFDEFASWGESREKNSDAQAWMAAGDASPCRLVISSAKGKNNKFYRLRSQVDQEIDIIRLHWKLHPYKDDEWYEGEKKRRSPAELAQEVDIDYAASVVARAAENWNQNIHVIKQSDFIYDPKSALQLTCDFNINPMCWNVSQRRGIEDVTFKEYTVTTTITETVIKKFIFDFEEHQNKIVYIYGDESGKSGSTKSRLSDYEIMEQLLKRAGWLVHMEYNKSNPSHADRIAATNKRLKDYENDDRPCEFITDECIALIESIEQTEKKDGSSILKNGMEHHFDAWSYRIAKKYPVKERRAWVG